VGLYYGGETNFFHFFRNNGGGRTHLRKIGENRDFSAKNRENSSKFAKFFVFYGVVDYFSRFSSILYGETILWGGGETNFADLWVGEGGGVYTMGGLQYTPMLTVIIPKSPSH